MSKQDKDDMAATIKAAHSFMSACNSITYPAYLLPRADGPAEVIVVNDDGSYSVIDEQGVSDFPPDTPQKRIVSDS